jgi:hypothetical protein
VSTKRRLVSKRDADVNGAAAAELCDDVRGDADFSSEPGGAHTRNTHDWF